MRQLLEPSMGLVSTLEKVGHVTITFIPRATALIAMNTQIMRLVYILDIHDIGNQKGKYKFVKIALRKRLLSNHANL